LNGPLRNFCGEEIPFKVTSKGQPIEGTTVSLAGYKGQTNKAGIVEFPDVDVIGAFKVRANKAGYEDALGLIQIYPRGNERIPIRGFREAFRYFTPFHSMRMAGANYVYFKVWYLIDDKFNLIPARQVFLPGGGIQPCSQEELEKDALKMISKAREFGLKVFIVPFLWRGEIKLEAGPEEKTPLFYIPERYRDRFLDQVAEMALKIAEFAERNHVEMLTPICELHRYIGYELSSKWHQEILPKLRERYSGKLVVGDQDYMQDYFNQGKNFSDIPDFNYAGYDYIGLIVNPSGTKSWDGLERSIEKTLDYADHLRQKYGCGVIISNVGTLGDAKWILDEHPSKPDKARAEFFKVVLQKSMGRVEGLFFNGWHYNGPVETIVGQLTIQGKEPYDVVRKYFTKPGDIKEPTKVFSDTARIHIDGDSNDWKDINPVCVDPRDDAPSNKQDLKAFYMISDNEYLYLMIELYVHPSSECLMSIQLDPNPYEKGWLAIEIDPRSNRARLGSTTPECWDHIGSPICDLKYAYGNVIELKVPLERLFEQRNGQIVSVKIIAHQEFDKWEFENFTAVDVCGGEEIDIGFTM